MKTRKIPLRRCIGCREMREKRQLIRIVRNQEGVVSVDATGRMNGRGAYLCRDPECYVKARKARALNREFSADIAESVYEEVAAQLEAHVGK